MKPWQIVLMFLIAAVASYGGGRYLTTGQNAFVKETAFDRVLRTGTLRCGYYLFPPMAMRDDATGHLSGFAIDMMAHLLDRAGVKVEWTEEVDFGNWIPALKAGRFDAICTPMWSSIPWGREALFTSPLFFSGIYPYVRADDTRFSQGPGALNAGDMTIAVLEGDVTVPLAQDIFPLAKLQALPQAAPAGSVAENVVTNKADALLWDPNGALTFMKGNPGSLRNLSPTQPLKIMPFELVVDGPEIRLKEFLDLAVQEMESTGTIDRLLDQWEPAPGTYLRLAPPVRTAASARF